MQRHGSPTRRGVVYYATGYGVRVCVSRGHLMVEDGVGRDRRSARFNRVTGRLRRLVVVASTGYISFDAIRWMADAGCALIQLDHTGRVLATSATVGSDHPALRRAQARAADQRVGVEISRRLLTAKLDGQQAIAVTLDPVAADVIRDHQGRLADCADLAALRLIEAQAAAAYWAAWRGVRFPFVTRDADRIPDHWTRFRQRVSLLTGSPRVAVDPINALANLLYALLEAESMIALAAVGLDPGIGIHHADQRARDSLALDLMEAGRPAVDRYLLDLLTQRRFAAVDFAETRAGQCRVMPRLAREVAGTTMTWAGEVAPHAEMIARRLAADARLSPPPTLLTGGARRAGRPAEYRRGFRPSKPPIVRVCQDCGARISGDRKRCPACHQIASADHLGVYQAREVASRRENGCHPSADPGVRVRIADTQRAQWVVRRKAPPVSGFTGKPSEFRRLILPRLADVSPRELAAATGLSPGYCRLVRGGKRIPHVRHWAAFQLAGLQAGE